MTQTAVRQASPQEPSQPRSRLKEAGATLQFLKAGFLQFEKNASFVPSSRFLCDAMVSAASISNARCVVEFGPGTGVITEAILRALPEGGHLHAIELDGDLLASTTSRFNDRRLRPIHGSATDAASYLREAGCTHGADAVISSVGIAIMSDELRASILGAAQEILGPSGVFVQFHYLHVRAVTYQFGQGWGRFDGRRFHERLFGDVRSTRVFANIPPAAVYACRQPRKAGGAQLMNGTQTASNATESRTEEAVI
jgi:phospholipid N-methyltransferase